MSSPKHAITAEDIVSEVERYRHTRGELENAHSQIEGLQEILTALLAVVTPAQRFAVWAGIFGTDEHYLGANSRDAAGIYITPVAEVCVDR